MNIIIDGQRLKAAEVAGENLEEILEVLQAEHISEGRLIGTVLVNGQPYSEDVPHAAVEFSRAEVRDLELVTHAPEEIALHFVEHGAKIIQALLEALPKITEMFRLGDEAEANEHYLRFLQSLHLLMNMLDRVGWVLQIRFDQAVGGQESVEERMGKLLEILSELMRIQEESDWIFLADILEYELTPELEAWAELLPRLRSQAH